MFSDYPSNVFFCDDRYSLESICELKTFLLVLHSPSGAAIRSQTLRGRPGILSLIAKFVLQTPSKVEDSFHQALTGRNVVLRGCSAGGRVDAEFVSRQDVVSAGRRSLHEGFHRWTVRSYSDSFAFGVIADASWHDFIAETTSWDWPFVSDSYGQGFALVKRRGCFSLCGKKICAGNGDTTVGQDRALSVSSKALLASACEFSVVLDFSRKAVYFEVEGVRLADSFFRLEAGETYRVIVSVHEPKSSVRLL